MSTIVSDTPTEITFNAWKENKEKLKEEDSPEKLTYRQGREKVKEACKVVLKTAATVSIGASTTTSAAYLKSYIPTQCGPCLEPPIDMAAESVRVYLTKSAHKKSDDCVEETATWVDKKIDQYQKPSSKENVSDAGMELPD